MNHPSPRLRLALLIAASGTLLTGCQWFHHRSATGCHEPQVPLNVTDLPPLRLPAGMDPPDARNAVRIPPLNEPERPRAKTEPCLSQPPNYGNAPLIQAPVQKIKPSDVPRAMRDIKDSNQP